MIFPRFNGTLMYGRTVKELPIGKFIYNSNNLKSNVECSLYLKKQQFGANIKTLCFSVTKKNCDSMRNKENN